jgi:hypothetical protein
MAADNDDLYGRDGSRGLLQTLFDFEEARDEKRARLAQWRGANSSHLSKKAKTT